jgi:hypothetical protein
MLIRSVSFSYKTVKYSPWYKSRGILTTTYKLVLNVNKQKMKWCICLITLLWKENIDINNKQL